MGVEIERKFLVASEAWRDEVASHSDIRQGYLAVTGGNTVRVRIKDDAAFLTVKSAGPAIRRQEFEYPIPLNDAEALLALRCGASSKSAAMSCHTAPCASKSTYFPATSPGW